MYRLSEAGNLSRESPAPASQEAPYRFRPMLPGRAFEHIRPLKPHSAQQPPIIRLGPDDRHPPISRPVRKHMLNNRNNFRPPDRITHILHFHHHRRTAKISSCVSSSQTVPAILGFEPRSPAGRSIIWSYGETVAPPVMTRRRGNPNWGRPMPPAPVLATEFEMQVRQLRLTVETYVSSAELRSWCERNRNRFYIPEWLLDAWDILVDPDFTDAA